MHQIICIECKGKSIRFINEEKNPFFRLHFISKIKGTNNGKMLTFPEKLPTYYKKNNKCTCQLISSSESKRHTYKKGAKYKKKKRRQR